MSTTSRRKHTAAGLAIAAALFAFGRPVTAQRFSEWSAPETDSLAAVNTGFFEG